jgi:hypothetical protein
MCEDLESLDLDTLREILAREEAKKEEIRQRFLAVEAEVQETDRLSEQQEESMMNRLSKGINMLKAENRSLAARIAKEEEYVRTTLTEKLGAVLKDKEDLQAILTYQESQVIDRLQTDIDRLTQESLKLESRLNSSDVGMAPIDPSSIDDSMASLLDQSEKTKTDYESELASLRREIERLVTADTILVQRVSAAQIELMTLANRRLTSNNGSSISSVTDSDSGPLGKKRRRQSAV